MFQVPVTLPATLDDKGRVKLPAKVLKQLGEGLNRNFVLKPQRDKGMLEVYPIESWNKVMERIQRKSSLSAKAKKFAFHFSFEATGIELDSSDRINIPNHLIQELGLKGDLIVYAYWDSIEIWDADKYKAAGQEEFNMEAASEDLFGDENEEFI